MQLPDSETAFQFRSDVYAHVGLPLPAKAPPQVLLYLRQSP